MDSASLTLWTGHFPVEGMSGWFLLLPCFKEVPVLNANSVDRDQTPRSAASDLGLHCLPMSLKWCISLYINTLIRIVFLAITTSWANSADDKLILVFLTFP